MNQKTGLEMLTQTFKNLNAEGQKQLLEYAEFLMSKYPLAGSEKEPKLPAEPIKTPPPENESVPLAIKRLSRSYPMLDKVKIMNPAAGLMTQHLTQGRKAKEVIADLEALFLNEYNRYLEEFHQEHSPKDPANC